MKLHAWMLLVAGFSAMALVGCDQSSPTASQSPQSPAASHHQAQDDHQGHDHAGHDHGSHSVQPASSAASDATTTAEFTIPKKPQASISPSAPPQQVVQSFLDSLRSGSEQIAGSLLTDKAWQETNREGLVVQPPGTPTAKYTIGEARFVGADQSGVHVTSTWTETFDDGSQESYNITWILRQEPAGWRIMGMATTGADSGSTLFLNFEDPRDMLSKWQDSEEEDIAAEAAALQASNPGQAGAVQKR